MKTLPKRGPLVLSTSPGIEYLIAEVFHTQQGIIFLRAGWPAGGTQHPAMLVDPEILQRETNGRGPYHTWPLEDDDPQHMKDDWENWKQWRDKPGATREDAAAYLTKSYGFEVKPSD